LLIYPAIDLRGGKCVRLRQGDYSQEDVFGDDPAALACRWASQGALALHVVDLDGAREGRPVNGAAVQAITRAVNIPVQLGGGIREDGHIEEAFAWGVSRIILGTRALRDPEWAREAARRYPGKVVLGLDAREGMAAVEGWLGDSGVRAAEAARRAAAWPLAAIIFTDISRDGMLAGPNVEATLEVARAVPGIPVLASGGVSSLEDIAHLARAGIAGAIVGRALYEGRFSLTEAIPLATRVRAG
jgi:phosphoribosylformimino-5-aminoimidazole carboxamide ribotide isomerase